MEKLGEGIYFRDTPGHGYIDLSPDKQAMIPDEFKIAGASYEEDCAYNIPYYFLYNLLTCNKQAKEEYEKGLKSWYWREYEKCFNVTLQPGESHQKDAFMFFKKYTGSFLVRCAWGDHYNDFPPEYTGKDYVRLLACKIAPDNEDDISPKTTEDKYFFIKGDKYNQHADEGHGFIIENHGFDCIEVMESKAFYKRVV